MVPLKPQRAEEWTSLQPAIDQNWILEPKWDGIRILARVEEEVVYLTTRNGNRVRLPQVEEELSSLPPQTIVDGEVVVVRNGGCDWGAAQSATVTGKDDPCLFIAFDLLQFNGVDIRHYSTKDRRTARTPTWSKARR